MEHMQGVTKNSVLVRNSQNILDFRGSWNDCSDTLCISVVVVMGNIMKHYPDVLRKSYINVLNRLSMLCSIIYWDCKINLNYTTKLSITPIEYCRHAFTSNVDISNNATIGSNFFPSLRTNNPFHIVHRLCDSKCNTLYSLL